MTAPQIVRAAHAAFRVTDLARARAFYVELLGFVETEAARDAIYLRGLEETEHHSLILRKAATPGVSHLAFKVAVATDLDTLEAIARGAGLPVRPVAEGEERGMGRGVRLHDPAGLPVEFYATMVRVDSLLQRFDAHHGPHIMRLDHFNCQVPEIDPACRWYTETLDFRCSEYTETDDTPPRLWAAWLHRKHNVHDLALMTGIGPRVHHVGFWVPETTNIIRACDILAGAGMPAAIERGPGRHGISNALFVYLRDPDGNRIELYTGDYLTADPDRPPIRWRVDDPRRQTFWGHAAPASWFDEASPVESIATGELQPTRAATLRDRPQSVT
ncbi:MAG: 3,4-dihydroxyphenylacetate 2,3-dioxygenase [Armatimonadota bacterium]|nr:3,4-dihydroxyphenylacetate 2,3-dioxygenase [Armatimonadota bacterium]